MNHDDISLWMLSSHTLSKRSGATIVDLAQNVAIEWIADVQCQRRGGGNHPRRLRDPGSTGGGKEVDEYAPIPLVLHSSGEQMCIRGDEPVLPLGPGADLRKVETVGLELRQIVGHQLPMPAVRGACSL